MKNTQLQTTANKLFKKTEANFRKNNGVQTTITIGFEKTIVKTGKNGTDIVITLGDESSVNARHHVIKAMGMIAAMLNFLGLYSKPTYIGLSSEAWFSDNNEGLAPSEDPKHKEELVTFVSNRDHLVSKGKEIIRNGSKSKLKNSSNITATEDAYKTNNVLGSYWVAFDAASKDLVEKNGLPELASEELNEIKKKGELQTLVDQIIETSLKAAEDMAARF